MAEWTPTYVLGTRLTGHNFTAAISRKVNSFALLAIVVSDVIGILLINLKYMFS